MAWLYTAIRAKILPIGHDEAYTFYQYVMSPLAEIMSFPEKIPFNNHLLNSVLVRFFCHMLGVSEFTIRIPALLGHALYLTGAYACLKLFLKEWPLILGLILMIFNPFLLELFSSARGYALGLGFLAWGIYFYWKSLDATCLETWARNMMAMAWLMAGAVLAQPVFLQPYTALLVAGFLFFILFLTRTSPSLAAKQKIKAPAVYFLLPVLPSLIFLVSVYFPIIPKIAQPGQFLEGGTTGFWQDTVRSLVNVLLYGHYPEVGDGVLVFIVAVLLSGILIVARTVSRKKMTGIERYVAATLLALVLCYFFVEGQHRLLGTKYVMGRMAVYFVPGFLLLTAAVLEWARRSGSGTVRRWGEAVYGLVIALVFFHFLSAASFVRMYQNPYDASTRDMILFIMEQNKGRHLLPETVSIGANRNFTPSISFYKLYYDITWLRWPDWQDIQPDGRYDYYYLFIGQDSGLWPSRQMEERLIKKYHLKVIRKYPLSHTVLAVPQ